jgi:hypothetical protein
LRLLLRRQFAELDEAVICRAIDLNHPFVLSLDWTKLHSLALAEVEATLASLPQPLREQARKLPVMSAGPAAISSPTASNRTRWACLSGRSLRTKTPSRCRRRSFCSWKTSGNPAEGDEEIFRDEVHTTLLHELGHYLGLDEDELTERGLE